MPTGYTADIEKGITFEQFAWSCARAFGALITMRDDPMDTPIPERLEPSDYNLKAEAKAREELSALNAMSADACEHAAQADYDDKLGYHRSRLISEAALHEKYQAMLARVKAWQPPTADHHGLKKFMVEQIESSMKFDTSNNYHQDAIRTLTRESGDQWRERRQRELHDSIGYHAKHHAEEVARTDSRNEWIAALRDSLTLVVR